MRSEIEYPPLESRIFSRSGKNAGNEKLELDWPAGSGRPWRSEFKMLSHFAWTTTIQLSVRVAALENDTLRPSVRPYVGRGSETRDRTQNRRDGRFGEFGGRRLWRPIFCNFPSLFFRIWLVVYTTPPPTVGGGTFPPSIPPVGDTFLAEIWGFGGGLAPQARKKWGFLNDFWRSPPPPPAIFGRGSGGGRLFEIWDLTSLRVLVSKEEITITRVKFEDRAKREKKYRNEKIRFHFCCFARSATKNTGVFARIIRKNHDRRIPKLAKSSTLDNIPQIAVPKMSVRPFVRRKSSDAECHSPVQPP